MRRVFRSAIRRAWRSGYQAGHEDGFAAGWDAALAAAGAKTTCVCDPAGCTEPDGRHCIAAGCQYCLGIRTAVERAGRTAWDLINRGDGTAA